MWWQLPFMSLQWKASKTNQSTSPSLTTQPVRADLSTCSFLHKTAAKIEVVVDETMMNGSLQNMVSVQERQTILNQLEINEDGRFPCRFPG